MSIYIVLSIFQRYMWNFIMPQDSLLRQGALLENIPSRCWYFDSCRLLLSNIPARDLFCRPGHYVQVAFYQEHELHRL